MRKSIAAWCGAVLALGGGLAIAQSMDVMKNGSRSGQIGSSETFTGTACIEPVFSNEDPFAVTGGKVTFLPGARSNWHTHPAGQRLVVGAPSYLEQADAPRSPQDLTDHNCINLRLPTHGGLYPWEFEREGREIRVRVDGQLTFNSVGPIVEASLAGYGLAYVPESLVQEHIEEGRLRAALEEWTPPFAGFFLYYPHRRQHSPAFSVVVDALRHHG